MVNFIKTYDNVLTKENCQHLIDKFEDSKLQWQKTELENHRSFTEININLHEDWKEYVNILYPTLNSYIEKYAPSKQQLKTYLLKKYLKTSVTNVKKQDVVNLIDIVLSDLEKNKFINDQFYSESKAKSLINRGNSINKIRNYLLGKGINDEYIKNTISKINEDNEDQDFFSAIKICKKKRIGPARTEDNRPLFYKKDISLLARNGFDFETSKKIMDMDKSDYLKIINLL